MRSQVFSPDYMKKGNRGVGGGVGRGAETETETERQYYGTPLRLLSWETKAGGSLGLLDQPAQPTDSVQNRERPYLKRTNTSAEATTMKTKNQGNYYLRIIT